MVELNIKELKQHGFLQQVNPEKFCLRIKVIGGKFWGDKLQAVSEIANRFGDGTVHFTSRQAIEIPQISGNDIPAVKEFLAQNGLESGVLGSRVRTITACQGSAICKHGKIATTDLAEILTNRTAGKELPHKFKIGITGCCNNCLKAEENDLGIKGGVQPAWDETNCTYCGLCEKKCPADAIKVDRSENTLTYNQETCIQCGKCVQACQKQAWQGEQGYIVYFGGTFGNRILPGPRLLPMLTSKEELLSVVDRTLRFYQDNGQKGERFGFMLERLGLSSLYEVLR